MKKKLLTLLLGVSLVSSLLFGCGSDKSADTSTNETSTEDSSKAAGKEETVEKDFPDGDYSDTGEGTFYVATASGTSEDGSVPVLFVGPDDVLVQIGDGSTGLNASNLTYVYIDGMLVTKDQMGDFQGSLDLQDDFLSVGTHKVEAVQYDTDQPDGTIITYKTCSYEVKAE